MVCSGSLALCFVNNDYVTAEIIYSTAHDCHEVLAWSRFGCSFEARGHLTFLCDT